MSIARQLVSTDSRSVARQERQQCAVCDHGTQDHDAISTRYCEATQAHALPRKCICQ
jgi:hypothetical protein